MTRLSGLVLILLASSHGFAGDSPDLFLPAEPAALLSAPLGGGNVAAPLSQGVRAVRINPALTQSIRPGQRVALGAITGSPREIIFQRVEQNARGAKIWVGEVAGMGSDYRAILLQDERAMFGRILTPEGELLLRTEQGQPVIIDVRAAGLQAPARFCGVDDLPPPRVAIPPHSEERHTHAPMSESGGAFTEPKLAIFAAPANQAAPAVAGTTIDVMVVVNNDLATALGAGLQARIDFLFALTNQAYRDSGVDLEIRRVGAITQLDYTSRNSNSIALDAITDGSSPFNTIGNLRNAAGADLVVFIRPYKRPEQANCGTAWISGYNQQPIAGNINFWSQYGYAVVSDGRDPSGYYCTDMTFPHELGHNMGLAHDRANGGGSGAYTYANGYGINGVFGTIMSYLSPEVARFSNPNRTCAGGHPCGVSELAADSAHAALALNNTKASIAAYRAAPAVTARCGAANTVPSVATPSDLCASGSASSVTSTVSLFSWICTGSNTVQCSAPRHYSLSASVAGEGSVNTTPNQTSYAYNTSVSLTARPASGKVLGAWGGDCVGTSSSCVLSMTMNRAFNVSFVAPTENHFSRMYLAAFLRGADLGGMNYWSNQIVHEGQSYQRVGGTIFSLSVVTAIYPSGMSDTAFVEAIYNNVFGRASDAEGLNYWRNELVTLRNTYSAQGSGNAAYEARGQLVMNMINAGLGTAEGTPGKAYIDNRFQVALYASERQRLLGREIPPATLRTISDGVTADQATVQPAKAAIDRALNP